MDIVNQGCLTELGGITAAQAALDVEINGYSDWYLPSFDELFEMYNTIGDMVGYGEYWSSSELDNSTAWVVLFYDGYTHNLNKNDTARIRVIRSF